MTSSNQSAIKLLSGCRTHAGRLVSALTAAHGDPGNISHMRMASASAFCVETLLQIVPQEAPVNPSVVVRSGTCRAGLIREISVLLDKALVLEREIRLTASSSGGGGT